LPGCWLLNYTDPLPPIEWAMTDYTRIKMSGYATAFKIPLPNWRNTSARPYNEISYSVAGINHMAWFLKFEWRGKDAYPLLKERFKDPAVYSGPDAAYNGPDVARAELFKAFGYYVTESSKHVSTYLPYSAKTRQISKGTCRTAAKNT